MWGRLVLLLALTGGTLSLDKLNMCMTAKHHKTEPGVEGELYKQVTTATHFYDLQMQKIMEII